MNTKGVLFLYNFAFGNWNLNNPGSNIISVTDVMAGDFGKENLTSTPLREVYRSLDITGFKEIIIETDDTTVIPDTFAILNHNFSANVVVQIQGSQTSDFTSPAFTLTMTYNEKHMVLLQSPGFAYNYYRFRILDPQNTCGFLEIGRIIGGQSFQFTNNEDITDAVTVQPTDKAYEMDTEGFFRAFNERVQVDALTLNFDQIKSRTGENANYLAYRAMCKSVGITYPFLTVVDPLDEYFQVTWGQMTQIPSFAFDINRYVTWEMDIQEVY